MAVTELPHRSSTTETWMGLSVKKVSLVTVGTTFLDHACLKYGAQLCLANHPAVDNTELYAHSRPCLRPHPPTLYLTYLEIEIV